MGRWAGSASLKVYLADMTDDPRALCFRASPAIWFVTFPAKRARRRCAFRTANVKEKTTSSRVAVRGRVSADARCRLDRRSGSKPGVPRDDTPLCGRHPPAPADRPVELSDVSEKGLGERKSKILRGLPSQAPSPGA